MDMAEVPIGTIFPCCIREVNHSGWILCDGKEYDNSDGIFDLLLEMDIGKNGDDGKYISPDFRHMEFVDTSTTDNDMFVRTFNKIIKNDGHVHSFSTVDKSSLKTDYMDMGVSIFHYNSDFIDSFMELYRNSSHSGHSGPSISWMMKYK